MVIGLLTIAAIPTTIGIAQGISRRDEARKDAQDQAAEQLKTFTLECYCESHSVGAARLLHRGRIYLSPPSPTSTATSSAKQATGSGSTLMIEPRNNHTDKLPSYEGFYIEYADPDRPKPLPMGLVTYVWDQDIGGKTLNWIYVDRKTRELRYGNRSASKDHIVGPWSWDSGEQGGPGGVTLDGDEGAVAVEMEDGWHVCWEDGEGKVGLKGKNKVQISLERRMVEQEEEGGKAEGEVPKATATEPSHATTTNTQTELTQTRFEDKAETRGEKGGSMVKVTGGQTANQKNKKKKEPKLEIVGQTTTRPMK